jgi:nicotinamide-nucleotide amidase
MDADLLALSEGIRDAVTATPDQILIATAESCTGGWVAQVITHTAGSSAWFDRGFVTYSNEAKIDLLGVRPDTLENFGAVSLETAEEMAAGALKNSNGLFSLAITGIAGPTGGSPGKPVGTVCFAWCRVGEAATTESAVFGGNREEIRRQAVIYALRGLLTRLAAG